MEYEQALIIGRRRRADAAMALGGYMKERVMEVCAVKPSKDSGLDAGVAEKAVGSLDAVLGSGRTPPAAKVTW
jgi:hypothetical protein